MKIKVGDQVKVIAGQYKGNIGKVLTTLKNENKVIIEGVNIHKRHVKPNQMNQTGGIYESEAPIHVSNVKKIEDKKETKEVKKTSKKKAS